MDTMLVPDETLPPEPLLLEACKDGNFAKVVRLLNALDDVPPGGKALLGAAAAKGHPHIVRFLLMKYDKQQLNVEGYHALMATFGGIECYRMICEREPTLIHQAFPYNGSAMQMAIARSDVDLLLFTLQHGADPGRVLSDEIPLYCYHFVPIETAILCSTLEVTRILIHHGATPKDTRALDIAAGVKKRDRLQRVVFLVEEGADINATSREQKSTHGSPWWGPPLQSAIQSQHLPTVQYLLEKGASPTVLDSNGATAWDKAAAVGNQAIIQLLAAIPRTE
ncbi:MAG: hypothetical protein Q9209_005637 [Squamulea sp. 1 TL-2023]